MGHKLDISEKPLPTASIIFLNGERSVYSPNKCSTHQPTQRYVVTPNPGSVLPKVVHVATVLFA